MLYLKIDWLWRYSSECPWVSVNHGRSESSVKEMACSSGMNDELVKQFQAENIGIRLQRNLVTAAVQHHQGIAPASGISNKCLH
jgi:hypothetical protein